VKGDLFRKDIKVVFVDYIKEGEAYE